MEVFEFMPYNRYDPQGRIRELFGQRGHEFTEWHAGPDIPTGKRTIYRTTGVKCGVCGQWALYGAMVHPTYRIRKLAIWGPALTQECLRGPQLIGGIPKAAPRVDQAAEEASAKTELGETLPSRPRP